ncbi:hypothetical protein P5V15_014828 [Pogonomyrmex californicus]
MGGGDLNLKKSWHPSTMKNMEKVRKAEQQNNQENKRIAELKKQIEMEKDREDIKKYAMEQGVIENKDNKKLDWMYKGPNQMVNREEYLLGRPVDKAFEQMQQAEKDAEFNRMPKNHVEYECIPPSLRFFSGNEQVDLARKIQEDPLYAIRKKEIESRNQLLKNPVKLKQLKELLEQQSSKSKSEKKKKKSRQKNSSEDETKLDMLLATKYKQLKDNISEKNLLKSMKKIKHNRIKKSKKHCHDSDSETSDSSEDTSVKKKHRRRKKRKRSTSDNDDDAIDNSSSESIVKYEKESKRKAYDRKHSTNDMKLDDSKKQVRKRKLSEDRSERSKKYREEYKHNTNNKQKQYEDDNKERSNSKNKYDDKRIYSPKKQTDTMIYTNKKMSVIKSDIDYKLKNKKEERYQSKARPSFTEEEKEQRRKEMMANAVWRDKEREKNVQIYREQEKKEEHNTSYNKDFIRKQLIVATEMGTVASRIKANINNIQRSDRAMDTNFAKR